MFGFVQELFDVLKRKFKDVVWCSKKVKLGKAFAMGIRVNIEKPIEMNYKADSKSKSVCTLKSLYDP